LNLSIIFSFQHCSTFPICGRKLRVWKEPGFGLKRQFKRGKKQETQNIPVVYEKLTLNPHAPFIVQFAIFVQNGVFWHMLIDSIGSVL
jgi:hypothetical protein